MITLTPSFSDHDCEEAISLMSAELSDFCFDPVDVDADFEATLAAEQAPTNCEFDCAHLWYAWPFFICLSVLRCMNVMRLTDVR